MAISSASPVKAWNSSLKDWSNNRMLLPKKSVGRRSMMGIFELAAVREIGDWAPGEVGSRLGRTS